MAETRGLSLNDLIIRLHEMMRSFSIGLERIIDANMAIGESEITALIGRINERLIEGKEVADNKVIIRLLNLLMKDQMALRIVREDAAEWLVMLDAIENHLNKNGAPMTKMETEELKEIEKLSGELRNFIRKG